MQSRVFRVLSWLVGIAAVVAMALYFRPETFWEQARAVGIGGVLAWVALTLVARFIQGEATVVPLAAMGFQINRSDVFWIGWLRTFANQVLPVSGVLAYVHAVRAKTNISWSELAAMAAPQFVLAATAVGIVGLCAMALQASTLEYGVLPIAVVYGGVTVCSIALIRGSAWAVSLFPKALAARAAETVGALQKIAAKPRQIFRLVAYHAAVILFRGLRIWVLFAAAGIELNWSEALLLIAITESTLLIQLTPGGLGIREGAIIGAAALIGVPADVATGVALLDRIFIVALIALLTPPSIAVLEKRPFGRGEPGPKGP